MTVCIAALCEGNTVFGASDRMLTSGDIEFEPEQQKIYQLSSSIAVMVAGDASLQTEIFMRVRADVHHRIETDPNNWWLVQDVANLYSRYHGEAKLKRAESTILAPLGLNRESFIEKQQQMAPTLVSQLAQQMINFEIPKVEAIIAGIDQTGGHIYVADGSEVSCEDTVGFASIGVGRWHANSQFMFAGHTRNSSLPRTAYLTFSAKRRAEVAPGVGSGTDMFAVMSLGGFTLVGSHVLEALDQAYKRGQRGIGKSSKRAEDGFATFMEHLGEAQPAPEQKAGSTGEQSTETGPPTEPVETAAEASSGNQENRPAIPRPV